MVSSALKSPKAVAVNIEVVRVFVRLRQVLAGNADLAHRLKQLELKMGLKFASHDEKFRAVFQAIHRLISEDEGPAPEQIGFRAT
jgi:hypothetical protein